MCFGWVEILSFSLSGHMGGDTNILAPELQNISKSLYSTPEAFPRQSAQTLSVPFSKVQHIFLETMEETSGDITTGVFSILWLCDFEEVV